MPTRTGVRAPRCRERRARGACEVDPTSGSLGRSLRRARPARRTGGRRVSSTGGAARSCPQVCHRTLARGRPSGTVVRMAATTVDRRTRSHPAAHAASSALLVVLSIALVWSSAGGWSIRDDRAGQRRWIRSWSSTGSTHRPGRTPPATAASTWPVSPTSRSWPPRTGSCRSPGQVGGVGVVVVVARPDPDDVPARVGHPRGRDSRSTAATGSGGWHRIGSHCAPEPCLHWGAIARRDLSRPAPPARSRAVSAAAVLGVRTRAGIGGRRGSPRRRGRCGRRRRRRPRRQAVAAAEAGAAVRGATGAAGERVRQSRWSRPGQRPWWRQPLRQTGAAAVDRRGRHHRGARRRVPLVVFLAVRRRRG